jgi:hypothetical protein
MNGPGQQEIRPNYGTNGEDSHHPFHDFPLIHTLSRAVKTT